MKAQCFFLKIIPTIVLKHSLQIVDFNVLQLMAFFLLIQMLINMFLVGHPKHFNRINEFFAKFFKEHQMRIIYQQD